MRLWLWHHSLHLGYPDVSSITLPGRGQAMAVDGSVLISNGQGDASPAIIKAYAQLNNEVADLVIALSAFPTLQTISRCQGSPNLRCEFFLFMENTRGQNFWRELAEVVGVGSLASRRLEK